MKNKTSHGFTLIEVMIVIAILGIIVAIAVPGYGHYIKQVNRKAAIAKMQEISQILERQYNTVRKGAYPASYPAVTSAGYHITVTLTNQSYTITASQGIGAFDDDCGTLTLTSDGATTATGINGTKCFK